MLSQKLHILNIPELDNIVIEIKDHVNYEVQYYYEKKDLLNKIDKDVEFLKNSVILVNQKDFTSIMNKTNEKYIHCITKFPLKISNLIDQVNAKLIQQKFLVQSNINIKEYFLDVNSRILRNKNYQLKLTEREIDIIIFLHKENKPVKVDILQNKVWKYGDNLETHTVETHIYRLRKKIKEIFNDVNFIKSKKNGYIINE